MDNMHNAELYGRVRPHKRGWRGGGARKAPRTRVRVQPSCAGCCGPRPAAPHCTLTPRAPPRQVLRCNYAQPQKIRGGDAGFSTQPVWADADDYQERLEEAGMGVVADE